MKKNIYMQRVGKYILFLGLLMFAFAGCKESSDFPNKVYITQAKYTNYASLTLYDGVGDLNLTISSVYKMDENVKVTLEVLDEKFLEEYNKEHHTEYRAVPTSAISLEPQEVTIGKKFAFSNGTRVIVKKWEGFVPGADYAVPVKIEKTSNGMSAISGSDVILLELSENLVSNAAYAPGYNGPNFSLADKKCIFGDEFNGKPYGQITIEGKFKFTKTFTVPGNWRADLFAGFGLQVLTWNDGQMDVRFPDSKFIGSFGKMSLNKWHHFAVTNDNGVISCYIDGDLKMASSYTGVMTAGNDFSIGGWANNCGLAVDEFRIWKTVRTAKQIKKYQCIVDANNPDLLAYYKFNESTGKISKDSTPHGFDLKTDTDITWITGVTCP